MSVDPQFPFSKEQSIVLDNALKQIGLQEGDDMDLIADIIIRICLKQGQSQMSSSIHQKLEDLLKEVNFPPDGEFGYRSGSKDADIVICLIRRLKTGNSHTQPS